jgi:hypothetical protein
MMNTMGESRQREADEYIAEYLRSHPAYQGDLRFEFERCLRGHHSP